jgi:hypothetical protein
MTHRVQYAPASVTSAQLCQLWSAYVDGLERHLSANTWALGAVVVALISYPISRTVMLALLHGVALHNGVLHQIVPGVLQTLLNFI